ncbi:MAG: KpsF/GutQ family sugar-phosphate isomerase [Bacteroidetes bacterium]|nr:KpsF/GutQ family sugar-phosphate isomerase [Bacteroidota bacterium]
MKKKILEIAHETIKAESDAIFGLIDLLDDEFEKSVELIFNCKGRLIITGIGKSAIIAQKLVASYNSTGTPSVFMHAADAIHGDIGMVQPGDVVMILSKSGDSPEIKVLIPLIKNMGNSIIAICGNKDSYLAHSSSIFVNSTVPNEACPNNLAPTSSATAQMVIGDAIMVCLMNLNGFTSSDFARYHPGGALGKKLYLRVADLYIHNEKPQVNETSSLNEVIIEITKKRLGVTVVLNESGNISGIITDGDLRRMLTNPVYNKGVTAKEIMSTQPKLIEGNELAIQALDVMRKHNITQLIVTDNNKYAGVIHLHDLINEGII